VARPFPPARQIRRVRAGYRLRDGGEAIGEYRGEPLYHASLDPSEYERLLASHGFAVEHYISNDPACGGRTVWLAVSQRPD
jgi:hypothetical protein